MEKEKGSRTSNPERLSRFLTGGEFQPLGIRRHASLRFPITREAIRWKVCSSQFVDAIWG